MSPVKGPSRTQHEAGGETHRSAIRARRSAEGASEAGREAGPDTAELGPDGRPALWVGVGDASRARVLSRLQQELGNAYVQR